MVRNPVSDRNTKIRPAVKTPASADFHGMPLVRTTVKVKKALVPRTEKVWVWGARGGCFPNV